MTEISDFRFSRPQNGNSDLVSCCSVSDGVRLNTYSDSIGPVWSSVLQTQSLTVPSGAAIQRPPSAVAVLWRTGRGAVQKHQESTPVRRSGWLRPGPNQFRPNAATSRSGSNTV